MSSTIEDEIVRDVLQRHQGLVKRIETKRRGRVSIEAEKDYIVEIALYLRDKRDFSQVVSATSFDAPDGDSYAVVYCLWSLSHRVLLALKTSIPKEIPRLRSLTPFFESANWHERETHEMMGIQFEGHLDLGRLLLPEDWTEGFPLRKTFRLQG